MLEYQHTEYIRYYVAKTLYTAELFLGKPNYKSVRANLLTLIETFCCKKILTLYLINVVSRPE